MSASVNKVILVGNLGRDPEVREGQNGKIVTFSLATSDVWRDKSTGERRERTEWHKVVVFNDRIAEVCEKYLKKGTKVYIEGKLQTRKWQDQEGRDRYVTEVVLPAFGCELTMLGGGGGDSSEGAPPEPREPSSGGGGGQDLDNEIPF